MLNHFNSNNFHNIFNSLLWAHKLNSNSHSHKSSLDPIIINNKKLHLVYLEIHMVYSNNNNHNIPKTPLLNLDPNNRTQKICLVHLVLLIIHLKIKNFSNNKHNNALYLVLNYNFKMLNHNKHLVKLQNRQKIQKIKLFKFKIRQ